MRLGLALARTALLLSLVTSGALAQTVGSLDAAPSKDGSAGAESVTTAPTILAPTTPTPTTPPSTTPATPTPTTPTPATPEPTTPAPPTTPPPPPTPTPSSNNATVVVTRTPSPSPTTVAPSPPPTPDNSTTTPPPPSPGIVSSPPPPDSPPPPAVNPEAPEAPSGAGSSGVATPVPVGSPTSVPYSPEPVSPSPPRPAESDSSVPTPSASESRASNTPSATGPSTAPPSSSYDGASVTHTPTSTEYSVGSSGTTTSPPQTKQYQRGDNVILVKKDLGNGTTVDVEIVISGSNSPALLVRDVNTQTTTGSGASKARTTGWLACTVSALAAATLLLLVLTHFVAIEPSLLASLPSLMQPNQWELLVFITYVQALASTAHYTITAVPSSLWEFLDAFSWTVFIPIHHSGSAITTKVDSNSRRLTEVVVLDGLVAFADRIGVNEASLLQTAVTGMLVIGIAVVVVTVVIVLLIKSRRDKTELAKSAIDPFGMGVLPRTLAVEDNIQPERIPTYPTMLIVSGIVVMLGVFALYPVTLLSTFEIASEIRAQSASATALAIAVLVIVVVPLLLIVWTLFALKAVEHEAQFNNEYKYRAVWGVLSSSQYVRYDSRVVFPVAWLTMQLSSAVVVGTVLSATWQLVLLLVIDVLLLAVFFFNRPLTDESQAAAVATIAVAGLKALNLVLSFAFAGSSSSGSSRHQGVATAFIAINSLVLVLWFGRQALTTLQLIKLYWTRHSPRKNTAQSSAPESNVAPSVPPSQFSFSPSSSQYESALYVSLASTQHGHRSTAVL